MSVLHDQTQHETYLELPAFPGRFGLRLEDDAMADALQKGDVVLLTEQEFRPGDVYAVRVGASPPFLAYIDVYPNQLDVRLLRFHDPDVPPFEVAASDLSIDGVCCGMLRGNVVRDLVDA